MKKKILLTLQIVMGILSLFAGVGKFLAGQFWTQRFAAWSLPADFAYVIGIFEIVAAILIFIPKTAQRGLMILATIMIGAIGVHLFHFELISLIRPLVYFILIGIVLQIKFDLLKT